MTDAEHQKWLDGWQQFMVDIWRERMMQFTPPVNDTGALARSIQGVVHPGPVTTIEHHFLEYGIYEASNSFRRWIEYRYFFENQSRFCL